MTHQFKEGDEVLVRGFIAPTHLRENDPDAFVDIDGDIHVLFKKILIPASALNVNEQLLEALRFSKLNWEVALNLGVVEEEFIESVHNIIEEIDTAIAAAEQAKRDRGGMR